MIIVPEELARLSPFTIFNMLPEVISSSGLNWLAQVGISSPRGLLNYSGRFGHKVS